MAPFRLMTKAWTKVRAFDLIGIVKLERSPC